MFRRQGAMITGVTGGVAGLMCAWRWLERQPERQICDEPTTTPADLLANRGSDVLLPLRTHIASDCFRRSKALAGLSNVAVSLNGAPSLPGSSMYQRFLDRLQTSATSDDARVCIVFHGTADENIDRILAEGLDPKRRGEQGHQLYGTGEYFHRCARCCDGYCEPREPEATAITRRRMLIFVVLFNERSTTSRMICPSGIVIVNESARQIPLGVLHYEERYDEDATRDADGTGRE
jgi:hypothetical protein